jgi:N6-adenosine-specific RNA methylase IME4
MTYDVILADPPWRFRVWNRDTGLGRSAESHYPTMTIDELCALPVGSLAADNCALFLWCCWPSIFEYVPPLLDAWGFEYKTTGFVWTKAKKSGFGFHFGMGYYTRANTEPCLLAIRGIMPVQDRGVSEVIYSPIRAHSQKPDEQYAKIEALYPGRRYVELFARRPWPGWDRWGNQVESTVNLRKPLYTKPNFREKEAAL